MMSFCFFFFFQAEDGIRDLIVTGVQTCALPIYADVGGERGDHGAIFRDRSLPREILLRGRLARLRHPHHLRRRTSLERSRVPPPSPPARLSWRRRAVRERSLRLKLALARRSGYPIADC